MLEVVKSFWSDEAGQGMAEYGLILALIAVVVMAALGTIGTNINARFNEVASELN